MKLYFCHKCEKLVPDKEVKTICNMLYHSYEVVENFYKNQSPETIGYCPINRNVFCAQVREPTEQEFYIYETCKANADTRSKK